MQMQSPPPQQATTPQRNIYNMNSTGAAVGMRPSPAGTLNAASYAAGLQGRRANAVMPDASDFPALTPTSQHPSSLSQQASQTSYASQAQAAAAAASAQSSAQSQATNSTLPQPPPHLAHLQQGQAQGSIGNMSAPPGLGGLTNGQLENLKTEDFPALSTPGKEGIPGKPDPSPTPSSLQVQNQAYQSSSNQPYPSNSTTSRPPQDMAFYAPTHNPAVPITKPSQQLIASPVDKWGLAALLRLIRTGGRDDQLTLSLGEDLANIGLDMNSSAPLYPTFIAPWAEPDALRGVYLEEDWRTPPCYNVNTPAASSKISMFSDETLFYAFYAMPRDQLQMEVAAELYARQWRYHKELGVWLTKDPGTEPTEKGPNYERGTYIIFDPAVFSRVETLKDFTLHYDSLEDRPVVVPQSSLGQPVAQQGQAQAQDGKR